MQDERSSSRSLMIGLGLIGLSIIISAALLSDTWKDYGRANQLITVTGSAKQGFTADLGIVSGSLVASASTQDEAYRELQRQLPALKEFFTQRGISADSLQLQAPFVEAQYEYVNGNPTGKILSHIYTQGFRLADKDVQKIKTMALDLAGLVEQGLNIRTNMPEYYYTKIAEVKIEIQAAAAKDAAERAARIAEATGSSLGTMRTARMGVLQITPPNSNEVSDYGFNDVSSIEKEITAVVSASFEIK